jgi:hypothetical protein
VENSPFPWPVETVGTTLRLIQVKGDKGSPWTNFGPKERQDLLLLAAHTGGIAELCWWPARKPCRWLGISEWPEFAKAAA